MLDHEVVLIVIIISISQAMTLFVYIGCGTAVTFGQDFLSPLTNSGAQETSQEIGYQLGQVTKILQVSGSWGITTALAFGLSITVLVFATSHLSGGQLNPAVSMGLALVGALGPIQCLANIAAQIVGAILGAAFLDGTIPNSIPDSNLGANSVNTQLSAGNAFLGECVMTFTLMAVVLETAVNTRSTVKAQAPLAIGFAVFCAHAVLLPIDGCSINPARSLGPAIVSGFYDGSNFWVFVIGPIVGALFAVPFHIYFRSGIDEQPVIDPVDMRGADTNRCSPGNDQTLMAKTMSGDVTPDSPQSPGNAV